MNVCVIKPRLLFFFKMLQTAGLGARRTAFGDRAALFVYEILRWDRICGSWWNKSLKKKKLAPVGNGKRFSRREACTHVCWLFTLGCDTIRECIPALTVGSPDPDPHFHA